jgi:hypothetical protein
MIQWIRLRQLPILVLVLSRWRNTPWLYNII